MMGSRTAYNPSTQQQSTNGVEQSSTPSRRGRGRKLINGERRTSGPTFIRDISAIMGDPTAPGYKPREERSYLEFHPDLDVGMVLRVMSAEDVDGVTYQPPNFPSTETNSDPQDTSAASQQDGHTMLPIRTASDPQPPPTPGPENASSLFDNDDLVVSDLLPATPASRPSRSTATTGRRGGPGRPPKTPKPPPLKPQAEVLNLLKPSYRLRPNPNFSLNHGIANSVSLSSASQQMSRAIDGVMSTPMHQHRTTKTMANVGYQGTEYWSRPKNMIRDVGGFYGDDLSTSAVIIRGDKKEDSSSTVPGVAIAGEGSGAGVGFGAEGERVEYDMDEQGSHNPHCHAPNVSSNLL